jgi:hypothetical protein
VGEVSAPFRDLFVELPSAVIDVLRAIGEQALTAAQRLEVAEFRKSSANARLSSAWFLKMLAVYFGWRYVDAERHAHDLTTDLVAVLECGHRVRYKINEELLLRVRSPGDEFDLLEYIVATTPRSCVCMHRPQETP